MTKIKNIENGKLPPQATDLERAVLGAIMVQKDAILDVIDIISTESFYKETHQHIYQAALELNNDSKPIDILTMREKLKKNGVLEIIGDAIYLMQLTNSVSSGANIESHAAIIEEKSIAREIIKVSSNLIHSAYDDTVDVIELTETMITEAYNIGDVGNSGSNETREETLRRLKQEIENAKELNGITGLKSGLLKQDLSFGGYKDTNLYIKAARPAMGKTSLVLSEALHMACEENKKVLFFSIEMSIDQLLKKAIAIRSGITLDKLNAGDLSVHDWKEYNKAQSEFMNENLTIIDIAGISLNALRKISKKRALKFGVDIIMIDYLQLMKDGVKGNPNREQEISRISSGLKGLAKELKVPIIALAQLSRAVETRGGSRVPQLSDLRESGSIEQDADVVQFLYRPEYYGITEDEEGNPTQGRADLINAKNRHGAVGTINVKFIGYLTKFTNLEDYDSDNSTMPIGTDFDTPVRHIPTSSQDAKDDIEDRPF